MPYGHSAVREDWLALHTEPPLAPRTSIVDPHHHLLDFPDWRYLSDDIAADLADVPEVTATVFVECGQHYYADAPVTHRPVGETAFVAGLARDSPWHGQPQIAEGIVGHVDLTLGTAIEDTLFAHTVAAEGRFRGVRHVNAHDPDPAVTKPLRQPPPELFSADAFRRAFSVLAQMGFAFDAWCYHPQISEVAQLAHAFPEATIVLDHFGGPLGIGTYANARAQVFDDWRVAMVKLSRYENVHVKLGGLGMKSMGHRLDIAETPPSSKRLAALMRPWVDTTIELFGVHRCMFESNFPMDKASYSYRTFWNACKRLTLNANATERTALFAGTAARVYGLPIGEAPSQFASQFT